MQFHHDAVSLMALILLLTFASTINPLNGMFVKGRKQLVENVYYIAERGGKPLSPVIFGKII